MTNLVNPFESGTNGTALTSGSGGNTAGGAGNFLDTVSVVASGTLAFDNTHAAHGTLSCKSATGATAGTSFCSWNTSLGSGISQVWFRQYLYFTANPGSSYKVNSFFTGTAGTICAGVQVNTTGTLSFLDKNGTAITGAVTTETIPLNAWSRIEGFVIGATATGQVELKIFFGSPDAVSPTNTYTSTAAQATNGAMGDWRFGINTSRASAGPFWQDDLGVSTTGYLGPAVTAATAPAPRVISQYAGFF